MSIKIIMKKLIIILFISFSCSYSQDKKPNNFALMESIVENFNSNNYDQIYYLFNARVKNEVESSIILKFFRCKRFSWKNKKI